MTRPLFSSLLSTSYPMPIPIDNTYLVSALPILKRADPELLREFGQKAFLATIPAGRDVFIQGGQVDGLAVLISGAVRVYMIGETGREITLYRFGHGESCILTANAILNHQTFPAIATIEHTAEAVIIPAATFRDWVRRYDLWREFVFDLLSQRLVSVMTLVSEVVFHRMDTRVATLLLDRGQLQNPISITHQEIATELGTSREVISRIIEDLADRGLLRTTRGLIEILEFELLQKRATM